ncbi:hypothetical protein M8J76_012029 [Diaphorina citri]|nr:hypothetical protein M8J76_012029 [Diaphorina citri]
MGKGSSQRKVSSGLQQNMKTNLYNLPRVPSLGPRICRAYTISPRVSANTECRNAEHIPIPMNTDLKGLIVISSIAHGKMGWQQCSPS